MKKSLLYLTLLTFFVASCSDDEPAIKEDYSTFEELGEITLPGGATAGEITAFDPSTNLLLLLTMLLECRLISQIYQTLPNLSISVQWISQLLVEM